MKSVHWATFTLAIAAAVISASGQESASVYAPRPAGQLQPGRGQAAIDQAAASRKYILVFFWKEASPETNKAWESLQTAAARFRQWSDIVSIQITDLAEQSVVARLGVDRAPMPLVLAIAPCGAITKAMPGPVDEAQLQSAFVSPGTQLCLKALQDRKLVFVCVANSGSTREPGAVPRGVQDFRADERYARATEVVLLDAKDQNESAFLQQLQVDPRAAAPVTIFLAPPGSVIGKFNAAATKDHFVASLASAQSNPCAGGKCGPNGCEPKR